MNLHASKALMGILLAITTSAQARTISEANCHLNDTALGQLERVFQISSGRDFVDVIIAMQNVERVFDGLRGESRTTKNSDLFCPEGGSAKLKVTRDSSTELIKEYRLDSCGLLGRELDGTFASRQQFTVESAYEFINLHYTDVNGVSMVIADGAYTHEFSDHYFTNDYESSKSLRAKQITKRSEDGMSWSASDFKLQSKKAGRGSRDNNIAIAYRQNGNGSAGGRVINQNHLVDRRHKVAGHSLLELQLTGLGNAIAASSVSNSTIAGCFDESLFIDHSKF